MDIIAFYPVENALRWGRNHFEAFADEDAFRKLYLCRQTEGVKLYHDKPEDSLSAYGIFPLWQFVEDFNNEDFDEGGWWCIHLKVNDECIKRICSHDEIMDTTNSHDPKLVERINKAFADAEEDLWAVIMKALYFRDYDEMIEKEIMTDDDWVDWWALGWNWTRFAYDYLMKVADNRDLEIILNYLGA